MPRLLFVVNIPRFFVSHRLPLALAARAAGYDVHVATAGDDEEHIARIQEADLPFHPLPLSQHGTRPAAELGTLRALTHLYRDLKPDLVHHVSIKPVLYGGIAARQAGVRGVVAAMSGLGYVFIGDGLKPRLLRAGVAPALRHALRGDRTRMIFQNPDDRDRFVAMGLIAAERSVVILGSGVDLAEFQPGPEPAGTPVVLFAGRLLWKKGLRAFVAAAEALHGEARFAIAGYPEPSSPDAVPPGELEALAASGAVEMWGRRDDMPRALAEAAIICLPSSYGEGVPRVLVEAAACGRPIVTTDTPGCREIVQHERNGLLVPVGDTPALIQALQRLLGDRELRARYGQAGRRHAADYFSLDVVVRQTLAVYESLL
jgi:glycosyltransferase involved in cell wall biosynthesis